MKSSVYINNERKQYSYYVIADRAIPHLADGLKSATRRILWMARDGNKLKSSALAGACAVLHPHAAPEGSINTLAAPYGNNITLLTGYGAFGTLLKPTSYGASRYTAVRVSDFTKQVVFVDVDLVPMVDNYDGTTKEPKHFLPLIPIVILNPQEGIGVGFASDILPRSLQDITSDQIKWLSGNGDSIVDAKPSFKPSSQQAIRSIVDRKGKKKWIFRGEYVKSSATTIVITMLPYGTTHKKFIEKLETLEDNGTIIKITDDSTDKYNIHLKFKKGSLTTKSDDDIIKLLNLEHSTSENLNVVDYDGTTVIHPNYPKIIAQFTQWRLGYYTARFQLLAEKLAIDIQRLNDVLLAIQEDVGSLARSIKSKAELLIKLSDLGILQIEYIGDLPIYRFTEEERLKAEKKLEEHLATMKYYENMIADENERKKLYISELNAIRKKF